MSSSISPVRKCVEHSAFSYHVVKQQAEAIRLQKEIQSDTDPLRGQEIQFTQESDVIRALDEYQSLFRACPPKALGRREASGRRGGK
jgi:hypothetical protein